MNRPPYATQPGRDRALTAFYARIIFIGIVTRGLPV